MRHHPRIPFSKCEKKSGYYVTQIDKKLLFLICLRCSTNPIFVKAALKYVLPTWRMLKTLRRKSTLEKRCFLSFLVSLAIPVFNIVLKPRASNIESVSMCYLPRYKSYYKTYQFSELSLKIYFAADTME